MPRADRRFTGKDIARLYCRNLSPSQQAMVAAVIAAGCDDELTDQEFMAQVLRFLANIADDVDLPGMQLIAFALRRLALAVEIEHTEEEIRGYLDFGGVML